MSVPKIRVQRVNAANVREDGSYVLYWMIANRRLHDNFALQRAAEWASKLHRPLLIFEALRCDYQWASDRLHRFVMQGMLDNQKLANSANVTYLSYVEPQQGHGSGLLQALAERASVVVTDDFPCFFLPRMVRSAARHLNVCVEAVDSNGLLPLRAADSVFTTAYSFRRFLQKNLRPWLTELPDRDPLVSAEVPKSDCRPVDICNKWNIRPITPNDVTTDALASLPIDHSVGPAAFDGGSAAAEATLQTFLQRKLSRYATDRNQPDDDPSSGLSPYLHFGHISAHSVFRELAGQEEWTPDQLGDVKLTKGSRSGWWGMSESAESFLDELITWRELGYNMSWQDRNYDRYESLPAFAQETLQKHASDRRPVIYEFDDLLHARTGDEIWNAAQIQLVTEGRMHNYLRMLWGKKILEWSPHPRDALKTMIELNNRFAVDGRNPNSYSGIFWVLGRYDRAWGPERPIFGKIRYMTSDSTRRKLRLDKYLAKYAPTSISDD